MALKITTAAEPMTVNTICLTIYSQPGLGKTSLSFTAKNPLLFDFDKGAYRADNRKDVVQVEDWQDVANVRASDLEGYNTIIVDTVGKALDSLTQDILRSNSRLGYSGALNQQGWGQLGVRFGAWLRMLKGFGKDVVLIAHMDEQKDGDAIKERLKIPGGSKDLVLTDSDAIARISIANRERHLIFAPGEHSFGKDPGKLDALPIPHSSHQDFPNCLEVVIATIKERLNSLSEEQVARRGEVEWFKENVPHMSDADAINSVLGRAKRAGRDVAKMVADRATDIGLEFDATRREYVYLEQMDEHMEEEAAQ